MTKYEYDPDLPYVVVGSGTGTLWARFHSQVDVDRFLDVVSRDTYEAIETTPKPKIPEDARFITWVDTEEYRWYAHREEEDGWRTNAGFILSAEGLIFNEHPDTVFTVLDAREEKKA